MSQTFWIIALVASDLLWLGFMFLLCSIIAKLRLQNRLAIQLCDKRLDAMKDMDEMASRYINEQNVVLAAKWREEAIRLNEEANEIVDKLVASLKV